MVARFPLALIIYMALHSCDKGNKTKINCHFSHKLLIFLYSVKLICIRSGLTSIVQWPGFETETYRSQVQPEPVLN